VNCLKNGPVIELLSKLGLKRLDVNVYIFLAKKGPRKGRELCSDMKITKQQLYPCLQTLKQRGIVNATAQHPAVFWAVPFEEVLDLSIKSKMDEAQVTEQHKSDLFAIWKSMTTDDANKMT
jgi:HTH-type transcriptional regulator, sugar sensing transcriptional regulator